MMKDQKQKLLTQLPEIEEKISYRFNNHKLLVEAFTHRSFINETKERCRSYERLEFLGDTVLGMMVAEYLYRSLPRSSEGELSFFRSCLVNAEVCRRYADKLNLTDYVVLGRGERIQGIGKSPSIKSDLFEAVIGALFIDGGLDAAKSFFFKHFHDEIQEVISKR